MTDSHNTIDDRIQQLFSVGAHIGYSKSHRHPTMMPFIYGSKDSREIIDLEETITKLDAVTNSLVDVIKNGKHVFFVGGKKEAHDAVVTNAQELGMPYVAGRWIGGTLSNFKQIRRQVDKLQSLRTQKEKGELTKYTKREQLSFDREIDDLSRYYEGLIPMEHIPGALFVIDPKQERIAVHEAMVRNIPVYALANTDCDVREVTDVIPANDNSKATIDMIFSMMVPALADVHVQSDTSPESADIKKKKKPATETAKA